MYKIIFTDPIIDDFDLMKEQIIEKHQDDSFVSKLFSEMHDKLIFIKEMPYAWPLIKDDYLVSFGIRFIIVKKYILIYLIIEDEKVIKLIRFFDGRNDWINLLKADFDKDFY